MGCILEVGRQAFLQLANAFLCRMILFRSVNLYMKEKTTMSVVHLSVHVCSALHQRAFLYASLLCLGALNRWLTGQKALAGLLVY